MISPPAQHKANAIIPRWNSWSRLRQITLSPSGTSQSPGTHYRRRHHPGALCIPLTVTKGTFNLFTEDRDNAETNHMRYPMTSQAGRAYYFNSLSYSTRSRMRSLNRYDNTLHRHLWRGFSRELRFGKGNFDHRPDRFCPPKDTP
ncbi:MAG: hypothetical protein D6690_10325 [Nitrospirae bacterium]|nr:MAG: hypothetical protein D6690_10325 [Nitrospirota bacterium]